MPEGRSRLPRRCKRIARRRHPRHIPSRALRETIVSQLGLTVVIMNEHPVIDGANG